MSEYEAVPVDAARHIALDYAKDIVIICSWDRAFSKLHTTTYGVQPADKISAAKGGEICAKALGMDLLKSEPTEDFRTLGAAKNAALKEAVERHLPMLKRMAAQIIHPAENTFSKMVKDLEAHL